MDEGGAVVKAPIHVEHSEESEILLDEVEATRLIKLGIVHRRGEAQIIPAAALSEGARVVEIGR